MSEEKEATNKKEATVDEELEEIFKDLPKHTNKNRNYCLYYYQGYWIPDRFSKGVIFIQRNFLARDDDIFLMSSPKSGTTWLKALIFSVVNRNRFELSHSPLLNTHAHDVMPLLENEFWRGYNNHDCESRNDLISVEACPQPRLLATHMSYESLPESIKSSRCKIVYICRNPMDQFVSMLNFVPMQLNEDELEEQFEMFCCGKHFYGPFWNHVLGFWKASLERPDKVLFLKYEEMKKDPVMNLKKIAEFLGFPFSEEEEKRGVIGHISEFCSIESMRNFEVNKSGARPQGIPNSAFFRKGEVGGSKKFLKSAMIERLEKIMQEKYGEHQLQFEF